MWKTIKCDVMYFSLVIVQNIWIKSNHNACFLGFFKVKKALNVICLLKKKKNFLLTCYFIH